jgi:hypothetical protein
MNAFGEQEHTSKSYNMTLYEDEMGWCYYGSKKDPTMICNSMELEGKTDMMDAFLQYMENGPVIIIEDEEENKNKK